MAFYLTFIRQLPIISSCTRTRIYLQPRRQFADRTQIPISCLPCTNQDTSQIHLKRRHKSIFAIGQKSSCRVGVWGTTGATHCGSFHPQRSTTENPLLSPESRYGSQPRPSSSSSSLSAWSSSLLSTSSSLSSHCRLLSPVPLEE